MQTGRMERGHELLTLRNNVQSRTWAVGNNMPQCREQSMMATAKPLRKRQGKRREHVTVEMTAAERKVYNHAYYLAYEKTK
jgi:hypothetical protein